MFNLIYCHNLHTINMPLNNIWIPSMQRDREKDKDEERERKRDKDWERD